jgi:nicotinamidase-related amidase
MPAIIAAKPCYDILPPDAIRVRRRTKNMSRTALLVIDVQAALITGADRGPEVLAAIGRLVERARAVGTPIIYLQHCHSTYQPMMKGASGWLIHASVAPKPGDLVIEKTASDGFYQTSLQSELDRLAAERLVICGLQTEFCVDATCRAALSRGFEVALAGDAHTTNDAVAPAGIVVRHHNYTLANLAHPRQRIVVMDSADIDIE